jgi:hypothetical protein
VFNDPINLIDLDGLVPGDKRFGLPDEFWSWYHQQKQKMGNPPDLDDIDDALEWHEKWVKERSKKGWKRIKPPWKNFRGLYPMIIFRGVLCEFDPTLEFCGCSSDKCT